MDNLFFWKRCFCETPYDLHHAQRTKTKGEYKAVCLAFSVLSFQARQLKNLNTGTAPNTVLAGPPVAWIHLEGVVNMN